MHFNILTMRLDPTPWATRLLFISILALLKKAFSRKTCRPGPTVPNSSYATAEDVRLQAYKGLIRPVLEYASSAWVPHQIYLQDQLESVQKRSARFVTSNYSREPGSMTKILHDLKLKPLKERRRQNRIILLCKGLHSQTNLPLERLSYNQNSANTRYRGLFTQLYARTVRCYILSKMYSLFHEQT